MGNFIEAIEGGADYVAMITSPGICRLGEYGNNIYSTLKDLGYKAVLDKSAEMMNGHKMELFVLQLSFIGWMLLGCITFGLAFIYVSPYMQATYVNFYHKVSSTPVVSTPNTTSFNSTL